MLNYVMMMGRLTADPEMRVSQSGDAYATFSIAVARPKPKDGEAETDFFSCIAWKSTAKFISDWFAKGSLILIVGTLRNNRYTDKDGNNRISEEIVVKEVQFTGEKKKSAEDKAEPEKNNNPDKLPPLTDEDVAEFERAIIEEYGEDGVPF